MKTKIHTLLIASLVFCVGSCTLIDLQNSDANADKARVNIGYAWPGEENRGDCDSVYVLMNRATGGIRYLIAEGSDVMSIDTAVVFGNYVSCLYACNSSDYDIVQRQEFLNNSDVFIRDFTVAGKEISDDVVEGLRGGSNLDFNGSYKYINLPSQIYSETILSTISDIRDNVMDFNLSPVLTNVNLEIQVFAAADVTINSIVAELSGVPMSIKIRDGSTSTEDFGRVIFPMDASSEDTYHANFYVTGIYPATSESYTSGPGILMLYINVALNDEVKILHPAINLRKNIIESDLLQPAGEQGRYFMGNRNITLKIDEALKINADNFGQIGGDNAVERWFDSDNIDVEI
ncbi:MAG: hypothetical protein ACI3ZQ_11380 [Candidatus Cryptobacteroides sp.]